MGGWYPSSTELSRIDIDRARSWLISKGWALDENPVDPVAAASAVMEGWEKGLDSFILLPFAQCEDACRRWLEALDDVCDYEGITGRDRWGVVDAWCGIPPC
jgi:hypothetical protein